MVNKEYVGMGGGESMILTRSKMRTDFPQPRALWTPVRAIWNFHERNTLEEKILVAKTMF